MPEKNPVTATLIADRVGALIDCMPGVLKAGDFDRLVDRITSLGHWSLLAVALLGLLVEVVAAFALDGTAILWGIGWLVALPLLQYTAVQFLGVTRELVQANRTQLGSEAFLRCYALVALVAAILIFIGSIVWATDEGRLQVFLFGLAFTALSVATAWLALNPSLLAISVNRGSSAGEEALGIVSFFVKTGVRLVPIFYGVTLFVGAIHGVFLVLGMIGDTRIELIGAVGRAELTAPMLIWAVLSPFLAYVAFVFYFLVIDLLRGILSIPGAMAADRGTGGPGGSRKKSGSKKSAARKKASSKKTSSSS